MKDNRRWLRAIREFAAERNWTRLVLPEPEQRALIDQLHGEPFHPAEPNPDPSPYPRVLGRHEHLLSNVMRGAYRGQPAVVFAYTRRQEVLDDSFGRHGWESPQYWIAALLDLPIPIVQLQVTPRTPVLPVQPGVVIGDPRIDEHFHVHTRDPVRAARVLRDLAPVLLNAPDRRWRISGTSILTWADQSGIPLDQVDGTLEALSVIAEHFRPTTGDTGP